MSLLPAFLAARLRGTLAEVERIVTAVEAAGSAAAAVDTIHPPDAPDPIGLVGALRSIRRRVRSVRAALTAVVTLLPERFTGVAPRITAFREALGVKGVLVALRGFVERHLPVLPAPLGFRARARTRRGGV